MGRGRRIDRSRWPAGESIRRFLEHLDRVHADNGSASLRTIAGRMHLSSASSVSALLLGSRLPADDQQLESLVRALGGGDEDVRRGLRLLTAARAGPPARERDPTAWFARSAYLERVHAIAPPRLLDRDRELAELAAFVRGPASYARWLAGPWAGKTALMAWFVLHPPPRTTVLSFFITAADASQSTSEAFTAALLDQLTALRGMDLPPLHTAGSAAGDLIRRRMLEDAATRAERAGDRLVLVVDGIDEDHGAGPGSGTASIVSLLPARPGAALRLVVAGRPDPLLPGDVPAGHPLRSSREHRLSVSPHATRVRELAERELDELLNSRAGDAAARAREVLGLVSAAAGGLTSADLQELVGAAPYELDALLAGRFGRTIVGRGPDARRPQFRLAHETLYRAALNRLGAAHVGRLRDRLHRWCDAYRERGWPAGTPGYLLSGYAQMLQGTGDLDCLVPLVLDRRRHRRMREVTGGNAGAVDEITSCLDLSAQRTPPDLVSMARLVVHRDLLMQGADDVPRLLPRLLADLGQPVRGDALARGIADPDSRDMAFLQLWEGLSVAGETEHADLVRSEIRSPLLREWAEYKDEPAAYEDVEQWAATRAARELEARIPAPFAALRGTPIRVRARSFHQDVLFDPALMDPAKLSGDAGDLTAIAVILAGMGDRRRAVDYAGRAEELARAAYRPAVPAAGWEALIAALAAIGDRRAIPLTAVVSADRRQDLLVTLARTFSGRSDHAAVEEIVRTADVDRVPEVLTALAAALLAAGDHGTAQALLHSLDDVAGAMGVYVTEAARRVTAGGWADAAGIMRLIRDEAPALMAGLAEAAAQGDEWILIDWMHGRQFGDLVDLIVAAASHGDTASARLLARMLTDPTGVGIAFGRAAVELAYRGDIAVAQELAAEAERIAEQCPSDQQDYVYWALLDHAAISADPGRVESLLRRVEPSLHRPFLLDLTHYLGDLVHRLTGEQWRGLSPHRQALALASAAIARHPAADRPAVVQRAWALVDSGEITDPEQRHHVARLLLIAGRDEPADVDRAVRILGEPAAGQPDMWAWTLKALLDIERDDLADRMTRAIEDPELRRSALDALAREHLRRGNLHRAAQIVTMPGGSGAVPVVHELAVAASAAGELTLAETLISSVAFARDRASVLLAVAARTAESNAKWARTMLARALPVIDWIPAVPVLGAVRPDALTALADEVLAVVAGRADD